LARIADVTTRATATLTGTVRDAATGLPVPGAEVRAAAVEPSGGQRASTHTDALGAFALTLSWPGDGEALVELDARGPAHAAQRWPRYDAAPDAGRVANGGALVAELALDAGFSLALEVVDETGSAVAGAVVDVIVNNTVAECCSWPLANRWVPEDERQPRTDAHGRLTVPGLRSGLAFGDRYFVSARHPDRAEGLLDRPENLARDPRGVAHARLVMPTGHVVRGVVRGAGRIAEGKLVTSLDDAILPGCHAVTREATLAPDGSFHVTGLRDGTHAFIVTAPGASPARVAVSVPVEEPLAIELCAGRRVSGSVLGVEGERVEGATVSVEWPRGYREATTDALGAFLLEGLPEGHRLDLAVRAGHFVPLGYAVLDASAADVSLVIDARRRVLFAGHLYDDRSFALVPYPMRVKAQLRGTTIVLHSETGADGCFAALLPPGAYAVGIEALGDFDAMATALLRDVVIEEGTPQDDLRVEGVASFRAPVRVIDAATGAPLHGAAVTGHPLHLWGRVHMGNTREDGVFHLEPAAESPVHVFAEAQGYAQGRRMAVELRRGMDPIVMRLERVPG
jgi:hypothetical protein